MLVFSIRLAGALAALLLVAAAPAGAALPGRNGDLAFHGKKSKTKRLFLRAHDGRDPRRVRTPGRPADPAFSPLGRRIAYAGDGHVWIMNADGTDPRPVTPDSGPNRNPTWSPAGDALAFERGPKGERGIYRIDADGNHMRPIFDSRVDDHSPAWSSRDTIAFVRRGRIYVVDADGGRARRLTRGEEPSWSPDGRRIAFVRGSGSKAEIHVMRANGKRVRRLTRTRRGVAAPAFSPNGRRIAFAAGRRGRRALHVMHDSGRGVRRISGRRADPRSLAWQPAGAHPVVAAAGDVSCGPDSPGYNGGLGSARVCQQRATSDLLLKMDLSAVLIPGDVVNEGGTLFEFNQAFHPTWGRVKSLLRPAPGNHDYRIPGAAGYFDYFNGIGLEDGLAGPRSKGYYSFDVGEWHIVSLNSMCAHPPRNPSMAGCAVGSPQETWLRADLAATDKPCVLAYWHHPPWATGLRGINHAVLPLVQALYDAGADVMLTGHAHGYERFAPTDPHQNRDAERGIRQFVVGMGGRGHGRLREFKAHSEVRNADTFGVLRLELRPGSYSWDFVRAAGSGSFTDSGANACH